MSTVGDRAFPAAVPLLVYEAEPVEAIILTAYGTHGRSQKFELGALVKPEGPKFEAAKAESGEGLTPPSLGRGCRGHARP